MYAIPAWSRLPWLRVDIPGYLSTIQPTECYAPTSSLSHLLTLLPADLPTSLAPPSQALPCSAPASKHTHSASCLTA